MSEAKLLRVLADKLESLDAVQEFPNDVTEPGTLTISWTNGSEGPGYAVLSTAISELVKQHWGALRSQVVKQRETEVQTARTDWASLGAKKASEPAASQPSSSAGDMGMRKVAA